MVRKSFLLVFAGMGTSDLYLSNYHTSRIIFPSGLPTVFDFFSLSLNKERPQARHYGYFQSDKFWGSIQLGGSYCLCMLPNNSSEIPVFLIEWEALVTNRPFQYGCTILQPQVGSVGLPTILFG